MGRISKFAQQLTTRHMVRGSASLLVMGGLVAMLVMVPSAVHRQNETTHWNQLATRFLDTRSAPVPQTVANVQALSDVQDLQTFTPEHLETALQQMKQFDCLTTAIYYEARSEPVAGQIAVGKVVLNRVNSRYYPNTICNVVYEGADRKTGCQFSFTCDGSLGEAPRDVVWERSKASALNAWLGLSDVTIGPATHYHTVAVDPKWSRTLMRTADVGSHIFYRFPNRRERRLMLDDNEI